MEKRVSSLDGLNKNPILSVLASVLRSSSRLEVGSWMAQPMSSNWLRPPHEPHCGRPKQLDDEAGWTHGCG